ncbi:thioredoxin family protein [Aliigemmobacter aestuarii]|uniref:Thioredoxin family protein n=1 Tax=Aliigemmobacter aestuarii TaxID=1445661 RepID=A0A4S3MR51_9RHOB|nr:thioredoxin family protein [Gemmobacter aestuarii]THD84996.1 thioredoxin family protein [Gemmobacter aestuarii]
MLDTLLRRIPKAVTLGAAFGLLASLPALASDLTLWMFEQTGCAYCERWKAEVGDAYAITEEGRTAPLQMTNIRDGVPEGLTVVSMPVFTPTFILARNGQEIGRIEGYPGEDFFWGLLNQMLDRAAETGHQPASN